MTAQHSSVAGGFDWRFERCGDPVMIATHRRSGTHLLIDFLRRQFRECQSWKLPGETTNRLYLPMGGLARGRLTKAMARRIIARPARPILKTHSLPTFDLQQGGFEALVEWAQQRGRMVYCMRDCRAVMASLYAYMQSFDQAARVEPGAFLRQTEPLPEFMLPNHVNISRPAQWALHVSEWLKQPDVLVVRFEDVLKDSRRTLEAIGAHLNLQPLFREPLLPARFTFTWFARLKQRLAIRPASTAIVTPGSRGGEVAWRELFSDDDLAFIEQEAGDVLEAHGYSSAEAERRSR